MSYVLVSSGVLGSAASLGSSIEEDFSDMTMSIASYVGAKSQVVAKGLYEGDNGGIKTTFDANGHGAYVIEIPVPEDVQSDTLYFSYDTKVDNASAYMTYSPKHLKFRSIQSSGCYWNTTIRWNTIMFGGGDCERDVKYLLMPGDVTGDAPWRTGGVDVQHAPVEAFEFKDEVWSHWDVMVKANTVTDGVANADGEVKIWLDGKLYWYVAKIEFRHGTMAEWKINRVDLGGYTSGNPGVIAEITIDNIRVSKESPSSAPMPPSSLGVVSK